MQRVGGKGLLIVDVADTGRVSVTGVTNKGISVLIKTYEMLESGHTVEQIAESLDKSLEEFRIFYTACNLIGAVDVVEQGMKEQKCQS